MKPGRKRKAPPGKEIAVAALFEREFPYRVPEELLLPLEYEMIGAEQVIIKPVPVIPTDHSKKRVMPKERAVPAAIFHTCQWLDGEPKDRKFCGAPTFLSSSFCARHYLICYRRLK